MSDIEFDNFDDSDLYDDFWVMASFMVEDGVIGEGQIGEVTLKKDGVMPFELEINGVTYKRED